MQQQAPQKSPFRACWRLKSDRNQGAKIAKAATYRVVTVIPAKRQKLFKAASFVIEPVKNAIAFVTEVMVMDGPAWVIPILKRSFAERCIGV